MVWDVYQHGVVVMGWYAFQLGGSLVVVSVSREGCHGEGCLLAVVESWRWISISGRG